VATPSRAVTSATGAPAEEVQAYALRAARPGRSYAARWFFFCDVCFSIIAYGIALSMREDLGETGVVQHVTTDPHWSMLMLLAVTFFVFYALGLYERELLAQRALHVITLAKAVLWSAALGALLIYLLHLPIGFQSRLIVVPTFAFFFLFAAVVRTLVISRTLAPRFKADMGATLMVGWPYRTEPLRERLAMLRGYNHITLVDAREDNHVATRVANQLRRRDDDGSATFGSVFIDAGSFAATEVLELLQLAIDSGANVYVASNRLRPLSPRRLLIDLFEAPIVRVRRTPGGGAGAPLKRAFDLAVAIPALVVLSPVMLIIAVAVKVTSRGHVMFAQERIGAGGKPFKFYKFRSMYVGNDAAMHEEYMKALICGKAGTQCQVVDGEEEDVYKLIDDPRITKVGRFLRRYSLDELPQIFNVLKGDMSLVGPRPPLPYEVSAYSAWHLRRLDVKPGITGVWQVDGRSRVTFDDMVFQDIMYDSTRDPLIDLSLCLRTVPAALLGHGAG
jgi:exopolysaccharide biosynthesis polyprenyl glycosylphosphotransferase